MKITSIIFLVFIFSCDKGINDSRPPKNYLEYGNVVPERLVAYYPFDGNAKDYSGSQNDGLVNGATSSIGRFGQTESSFSFDGVDDYIKIPSFFELNGDSGTVCFWVRIPHSEDNSRESAVISKIDTVGPGYVISVYGNDNYWFTEKDINSSAGMLIVQSYWRDSQYFFLAVTFETHRTKTSKFTRIIRYFDGIGDEVASTIVPTPEGAIKFPNWHLSFNTNNQPLYIGKSILPRYKHFVGEIDDLLIYDRALSESEILKLYNWK